MAALSTGIRKIRFTSLPGGAIGIAYGAAMKGCESMLTAKQEKFVQNILEGMTQADAYRSAYDATKMTDKTVHEKASLLASQDKVRARLTELRSKLANEKIMSAQKRMEWLTELIQNDDATNTDKLRALDILNKMDGEYVQKIQAEVQTETTINIELVDDDE